MTAVLDVEPAVYADAGEVLGDDVAECVRSAGVGVMRALDGSGGMAGSDPVGASWGASYDAAAFAALSVTTDVVTGCYRLAALLAQAGSNYARAEAASVPAPLGGSTRSRWPSSWTGPIGGLPSAVGAGVAAPAGWSLLAHAVGYLWPDGHQDLLRAAAQCWTRAGEGIGSGAGVDRALLALMGQRAPEVDDAVAVVRGLDGQLAELAHAYVGVAAAYTSYAHHLDAAHHAIIGELVSFAEATAAIEGAGALLSVVSFGAAELIAQGGEAAEITRAAQVIRSIIEGLSMVVGDLGAAVDAVTAQLSVIADRIAPILARQVHEVRLAMLSDRGEIVIGRSLVTHTEPATTETTAENAALTHLDQAAASAEREARLANIDDPKVFDPSDLKGMKLEDVRKIIPSKWTSEPSASGGGEIFIDPVHRARRIRLMPGYRSGSRPNPLTTGPYAVVSQNGDKLKIALEGNPTLP